MDMKGKQKQNNSRKHKLDLQWVNKGNDQLKMCNENVYAKVYVKRVRKLNDETERNNLVEDEIAKPIQGSSGMSAVMPVVNENILLAVDESQNENDLHSEDEVELHPMNEAELEDEILMKRVEKYCSMTACLDKVKLKTMKEIERSQHCRRIIAQWTHIKDWKMTRFSRKEKAAAEKLKAHEREGKDKYAKYTNFGSPVNTNHNSVRKNHDLVKSPSDTTMYVPGLTKAPNRNLISGNNRLLPGQMNNSLVVASELGNRTVENAYGDNTFNMGNSVVETNVHDPVENSQNQGNNSLINKLTNFVEKIRIEGELRETGKDRNDKRDNKEDEENSQEVVDESEQAKENCRSNDT